MLLAEIIVYAVEIYLAIGFLFAVWFVIFGVTNLDDSAKGTSFGFRFIIFFGAAAFWILLAWRLSKGEKRPIEKTARHVSCDVRLEINALPERQQRRWENFRDRERARGRDSLRGAALAAPAHGEPVRRGDEGAL